MADDIDIEEHDVLDNPRIRNIFPDLTRIKVEVPDSDVDEDRDMQTECYDEPTNGVSNQSPLQVSFSTHKNHIVIGSKRIVDRIFYEDNPTTSSDYFNEDHFDDTSVEYEHDNVQIKQEPEDSHDEEIERHGSRIILGSKPNRSATETDTHDVYSSVVMLEDWAPMLQRSNCYCKVCEILFPTRNCLDAHNMATHSFLIALSDNPESLDTSPTVKVNKAMKSTTKNLHFSTDSTLSEPSTSKEKFCNHCNKMFPSKTALITHLYENLTAKKFPCEKCDKIFNEETELIQHIEDHHSEEDDDDDTSDESKNGLYYQCDVCFCYFRRSFSRHMKRNHAKSTFSTKKVLFNGFCQLCGLKYTTTKNLNRHVRLIHSQYILKSGMCKSPKSSKVKPKITHNVQQVASANNPDIRKPNFKCLKCGEVFAVYNSAKRHKKIKHPEMLNKKIFSKIKRTPLPVLKKISINKTVKEKTKFPYNCVSNPPVPKSVLFKCCQCPLHFTNCNDAVSHAYRCVKEADVWNCDVCGLSFKFADKIIHERQHIVSDRFVVHLTNDNVYGRTLCQCPKCDIYYSEQEFWIHTKQGCGQPRSVPCKTCDILIHVSSMKMHKKLHKSGDIAAKDLILIEFVTFEIKNSDNEGNLSVVNKRKISDNYVVSPSKRKKVSTDTHAVTKASRMSVKKIMYYCEKCKICWRLSHLNISHQTGKCVSKKPRPCKKCGLYFISSYHDIMMHKSGETIFDFTFIRVQDNKIINPMPSFPKCLKCNVHFINYKIKRWHVCNNDYKICEYCEKMFSETAYALHVNFHLYALRKRGKTGPINNSKESQTKKAFAIEKPYIVSTTEKSSIVSPVTKTLPGKSPPMPDLLKQYELMTNTWNILYLCEVCDVLCDSYDKMIEHSQDHFNKMESYDMTIGNCEICDLRFDGTSIDKHKDMHDKNTTLNRQFFNILKYNYTNLFSDDWFELFGALPRTEIEQIVLQSIYVCDRNIRMRITQHGPPENTVYKCGRCNGYLTASMVGDHFDKPSCWSPRYRCKLCHLDFSMNVCLKEHQTVCRTMHQSYREVLFNDVNDDPFNKGLQMTRKTTKTSRNTIRMKTKDALYKVYKCSVCQCCEIFPSRIKTHRCTKSSERVKCGQCCLYFKYSTLHRHKPIHIKFPNLSKTTVTAIPFKPESYKFLPKLYKCQCGLHFTSLQTAEKHLTLCKPGYQTSKENCSKCGLLFPTSVLVSHLCSHHSNDKRTEFNIQQMTPKKRGHSLTEAVKSKTTPKIAFHRCAQCDVCFFTKDTLNKHFSKKHKIKLEVQHCKLCDVNFTKYSMTRHILLHHKLRQCSRAELNIKSYKKISNVLTEDLASDDDVNYKTHTTPRKERFLGKIALNDRNKYSKHLYKCRSCKIHFLNIVACTTHYSRYHKKSNNVVQKSTDCRVCGLAFALPSLVRHTQIHHERMKLSREDFIIIQTGRNTSKDLYKCDRCDVHFLTLIGYLSHCSKGIHSISKRACDICSYNFASNILPWHINIHHDKQKLSRKDLNIITPVFGTPLSQDSEINETTEDDEVQPRELNESETKSHDKKEQDTETQKYDSIATNRLYKCRTCSVHFCKERDLIDHVLEASVSGHKYDAATCQYCHLTFTSGKGIDQHINEQHEKFKLTKEFIIVENENVDGAYVSRYLYKCDKCNTNFVREANAELHDHSLSKSKCRLCGLLFSSDELGGHKNCHHNLMSMSLDDFNFVNVCGTSESKSSTVKINKNNRKLIRMYKLSNRHKAMLDTSKYDNTIYVCRCGLHYLTLKTFRSHIQDCNRRTNTSRSRATCKNCGFLFSHYSLSLHQYIQHEKLNLKLEDFRIVTEKDLKRSNNTSLDNDEVSSDTHDASSVSQMESSEQEQTPSNTTGDSESSENLNRIVKLSKSGFNFSSSYLSSLNINDFSNQLYQCKICHKHYITLSTLLKHNHDVPGEKCTICGLVFTTYIMLKHKYIHHERMGLNRADFFIQHNFADKSRSSDCLLYKCDICDMHFINFTSAHAHTGERCAKASCEEDCNCKYCGLRFSACSVETHEIEHHHKRKLKRSDFSIIHYSGATKKTEDNVDTENISSVENSTGLAVSEVLTEKGNESKTGNFNESQTSSLQKLNRKDYNFITPVFGTHLSHNSQTKETSKDDKLALESQDLNESIYDESETRTHHKKDQDAETQKYNAIATNRLYRCRTCSVHFCKERDLIDHVLEASVSGHKNDGATCQYCHLKFTSGKGIDRHINEQHEKLKLTKEFIIVENENVDGGYVSRYLYKCDKCNTNFVREVNAELHDHTIIKSKCRLCGLLFSSDELGDHMNCHHNFMNMTFDDFNFVNICGTSESESSAVEMNKNSPNVITMYNLSKRHIAMPDMSKYDNTIYGCRCGLHYLTLKRFQEHIQDCNGRTSTSGSRATCKSCGLLFYPYSLSLHQYIQHEKLNLKLEDFRIVTEKDLEQSNNTSLDNQEVSADLHDSSSVSQTELPEPEPTPSNTAGDSESSKNLNRIVSLSQSPYKFSDSYLSSLNMNDFSNQLYKCNICHKHYITLSAALKHRHDVPGEKCSICGLVFTNYIMLKHKYIHHERLGLNRADFSIQHKFADKSGSSDCILYKCDICDMHFINFTSAHAHTDERCAKASCEEYCNCEYCGLRFSACSAEIHEIEHHHKRKLKRDNFNIIHYSGAAKKTEDNVDTEDISSIENSTDFDESEILTEKADESEIEDVIESETSSLQMNVSLDDLDSNVNKPDAAVSSKTSQKNPIKLYKCGDCNVFYITQSTCYKHMLNHKQLDSIEYIECKLCGLQFRILTLHKHMIKHHKTDFNLKNVLIEEYQSTKDKTPRINIYYALDKVQSRLVSTTTGSKDVSEGKVDSTVDDVIGPVDDQESTEKYTVNAEEDQIATNSTAKNIPSPAVVDDTAKNNSSHIKEQIVSENFPGPITVENLSINHSQR